MSNITNEQLAKALDPNSKIYFTDFAELERDIETRIFRKHSRMIKDRDGIGITTFTWFGHDCRLRITYHGEHSVSVKYTFTSAPRMNLEMSGLDSLGAIHAALDKIFGND